MLYKACDYDTEEEVYTQRLAATTPRYNERLGTSPSRASRTGIVRISAGAQLAADGLECCLSVFGAVFMMSVAILPLQQYRSAAAGRLDHCNGGACGASWSLAKLYLLSANLNQKQERPILKPTDSISLASPNYCKVNQGCGITLMKIAALTIS